MTLQLLTLNFIIYEEHFILFFISVDIHFIGILLFSITQCLSRNFVSWSRRGEGTREGGGQHAWASFTVSILSEERRQRRKKTYGSTGVQSMEQRLESFVKMMSKNSILGVKKGITES
jgi:hypothetical protein